jgi:hypothetical protein
MNGTKNSHPLFIISTHCSYLREVRLDWLKAETVAEFAKYCPNMERFEVTLFESIGVDHVSAITDRWTRLQSLILLHEENVLEWTDALWSALWRLIQQRHTLSTLVCMDILSIKQIGTPDELCGLLSRPVHTSDHQDPPATSQLQWLWVQALPIAALQTVAAACPRLCELLHRRPVTPQYITALAQLSLKSVGFGCSGLKRSPVLTALSGLKELRLWDLEGLEDELVSLFERSPRSAYISPSDPTCAYCRSC